MKYTKVPEERKRLLKLLKHFFKNKEQWWELKREDGKALGIMNWQQKLWLLARISPGSLGNWTEQEIEALLDRLEQEENQALRADLLAFYGSWYRSVVEQGIQDAIDDSDSKEMGMFLGVKRYAYHFKSVNVENNRPIVADCFINKDGLVVFLKTDLQTETNEKFPKIIRTAIRRNVDSSSRNMDEEIRANTQKQKRISKKEQFLKNTRIGLVQHYQQRSFYLAKAHNLYH